MSTRIRTLTERDCVTISQAFSEQGWQKPIAQYRRYLQESIAGTRTVLVAERAGHFAGYITIVWVSDYPPFRSEHIPEIVDFNVLIRYRRQGIGSLLMDAAEQLIAQRSAIAGIGVGVTADYGAAHILYIKRGYLPDGRGIVQSGRQLAYGDHAVVNDDLELLFTKRLFT